MLYLCIPLTFLELQCAPALIGVLYPHIPLTVLLTVFYPEASEVSILNSFTAPLPSGA